MRAEVIPPGGGRAVKHEGWEALVKIDAESSDGSVTILETRHDEGVGASPHIHTRESETFLVLDGAFTFRVGDEEVTPPPGSIVFGPPGIAHGFDVGPGGGRLLHVFVPGGVEGFFTTRRDSSRATGDQLRREYGIQSVDSE